MTKYRFAAPTDENPKVFVSGRTVMTTSIPDLGPYLRFAHCEADYLGKVGTLFNLDGHPYYDGRSIASHFYRHKSGLTLIASYAENETTADQMLTDLMRMTDLG